MVTALTLDAIRLRKEAALDRRTALVAEISILDEEIIECEAGERLFSRINGSDAEIAPELFPMPVPANKEFVAPPSDGNNPYRAGTNKYHIWQCLKNSQNRWLTAVEIRRIASNDKGADMPMASVSPSITNIMNDGHIVRDGMKVALKIRTETKNPATEVAGL